MPKSSKSKEKKQKRKEEAAKVAVASAMVKKANQLEDHMASLAAFKTYSRNGLSISIECVRSPTLSAEDVEWAFCLTRANMKDEYVESGWGWKDYDKREELFDDRAWFIIARSTEDQKPLGFVNFRFDLDEQIEVLYVYEIHLEEETRRKGLGKFLMQITQLIAARASMQKVVATVFKSNHSSTAFFMNSLKFTYDESSPCICDPENPVDYPHEILSKKLKPMPAPAPAAAAGGTGSASASA